MVTVFHLHLLTSLEHHVLHFFTECSLFLSVSLLGCCFCPLSLCTEESGRSAALNFPASSLWMSVPSHREAATESAF